MFQTSQVFVDPAGRFQIAIVAMIYLSSRHLEFYWTISLKKPADGLSGSEEPALRA